MCQEVPCRQELQPSQLSPEKPRTSQSVTPEGPPNPAEPSPLHDQTLVEECKEKMARLKELEKQVKPKEVKSCSGQVNLGARPRNQDTPPRAQDRISFEDTTALAHRLLRLDAKIHGSDIQGHNSFLPTSETTINLFGKLDRADTSDSQYPPVPRVRVPFTPADGRSLTCE